MSEPTTQATATVATERPGRYGKQLVAHLGRRNGGEWDDESSAGWIALGSGRAELSSVDGALVITVTAAADGLDQMEDVVGRHLVRFGTKDELVVRWVRAGGEPGTEQTNPG